MMCGISCTTCKNNNISVDLCMWKRVLGFNSALIYPSTFVLKPCERIWIVLDECHVCMYTRKMMRKRWIRHASNVYDDDDDLFVPEQWMIAMSDELMRFTFAAGMLIDCDYNVRCAEWRRIILVYPRCMQIRSYLSHSGKLCTHSHLHVRPMTMYLAIPNWNCT